MKNESGHIKILSTLSLAASDTREDTLTSVILNTLYEKRALSKKDVCSEINNIYEFSPHIEEINTLIDKLIENKSIEYISENLSLTESQKRKLDDLDIELKDRDKSRYQNFKNFVIDNIDSKLDNSTIQLLWIVFVEFLYNNFYEYGHDALIRFHPHIEGLTETNKEEDFLQIAFKKLNDKHLAQLFRVIVEKFPDYATHDDIEFLNDLAQKTLSFASLGADPKISESTLEKSLVDWVLYLDTNVLYSLLNLHSHPENEASVALVQLIRDNGQYIKILLRYSELTRKELNSKRDDFKLLDDKIPDSSIRAMLGSDELDDFSKQFYTKLLNDRKSTVHPSEVIDFSADLLKKINIDISRNQKRVEQIGEDYLDTRIQEYRRYIDFKNEVKQQFCNERRIPFKPIYRSDKQIVHDITLREIILNQRSAFIKKDQSTSASFNTIKYFAVTLDQVLLDFDKQQLKDHQDERSFPIFFKPSFLLNKLVRVLPINVTDHKKAFLKAVSSRGFNKDVRKSRDILKIVNFLKNQGIDNEDVIYSLITGELFLDKYRSSQNDTDFNEGLFIQSELNRTIRARELEYEKSKEELNKKSKEFKDQTKINNILSRRKSLLEAELKQYKIAVNALNEDVKKLQTRSAASNSQGLINFEAEEQKKEKETYKTQLKSMIEAEIKLEKERVFRNWQRKIFLHLFWVVPVTALSFFVILCPTKFPFINVDQNGIRVLCGVIVLVVDSLFLNLVKLRYWDEGNMEKKRNRISAPESLRSKLEALD